MSHNSNEMILKKYFRKLFVKDSRGKVIVMSSLIMLLSPS